MSRIESGSYRCRLALATCLTLFLPSMVSGGLIEEPSWTAESNDGRYRLVMLQLDPYGFHSDDSNESFELKKRFSQSGVYLCGKSTDTFLWPIPYHPPVYSVFFASDGNHVLLALTNANHSISNVPIGAALYFFHKGGQSEYWPEHDVTPGWGLKLLTNKLLDRSPWYEWNEATFDPDAQTFTIKSNQAEEFVFDIRTGIKVRTRSAWNWSFAIYLAFMPVLAYGFRRFPIQQSRTDWRPGFWQVSLAEVLSIVVVVSGLLAVWTYSAVMSVAIAITGLIGGAIAQLLCRGRRSWWIGSFLTVYGTGVGLIVFGMVGEKMLWHVSWLHSPISACVMLFGCIGMGAIIGALVGALVARAGESAS